MAGSIELDPCWYSTMMALLRRWVRAGGGGSARYLKVRWVAKSTMQGDSTVLADTMVIVDC